MAKIITRFTNKGIVETVVGTGSVTSREIEGFPTPRYYVGEGGYDTIQEAIDDAIANKDTYAPVVFVSPATRTEDLVIQNCRHFVLEFLGGSKVYTNDNFTYASRLYGKIAIIGDGETTSARIIGLDIVGDDDDSDSTISIQATTNIASCTLMNSHIRGGENQNVFQIEGVSSGFLTVQDSTVLYEGTGKALNTTTYSGTYFTNCHLNGNNNPNPALGMLCLQEAGSLTLTNSSIQKSGATPIFYLNHSSAVTVNILRSYLTIPSGTTRLFAEWVGEGTIKAVNSTFEQIGTQSTLAWKDTIGSGTRDLLYGSCAFIGSGTITKDAGVTATQYTEAFA